MSVWLNGDLDISQLTTASPDARERLVAAALHSFAAKGYSGTTTRDIATGAGMSSAALYVHFQSKEEVLYIIARSGHTITLALVREAIASGQDPLDQLGSLAYSFTLHHIVNRKMARVVAYEITQLNDEHAEELRVLRDGINREVQGLIQRGVDAGLFIAPNPKMTALAILSLGIDTARWYRENAAWSANEIAEYYRDLALGMVQASQPSAE